MEKGTFGYWFGKVLPWAIPVAFLVLANVENYTVSISIAGAMAIASIYYFLVIEKRMK